MGTLTEKTALVTGASRGIGRAIAERLGAEGALVGVHYGTNDATAKEVMATIEAAGGQTFPIRVRFGTPGDVEDLDHTVEAALGDRRLDILVNNAGTLDPTPFGQVSPEAFDASMTVNVRAPFLVTQRLLPRLADGGRVVFVSSAVTRIASPFTHYAMGKASLEALARTLANPLGARGITVNAVAPGVVDTDMGAWLDSAPGLREAVTSTVALGRIAGPADVADVVAFLVSDDGRWVTGQTIEASGGQWLGPLAG